MTVLGGAIGMVLVGCRTPTQVTVEITTDLPCGDQPDTTVQVGHVGSDVEGRPASVATRACGANGRIGSFTLVPSGDENEAFAVKVILGHGVKTAAGCRSEEGSADTLPGCIFARRALHYLPHTALTLPIALHADCEGVICHDPLTTCVQGSCVSNTCPGNECTLPPPDAGPDVAEAGPGDADTGPGDADSSTADTRTGDAEAGTRDADTGTPPADACAGGSCPPPSCASPLKCGAAGDSCCESLPVTGDTFQRRNDPMLQATVSSFKLDKYETTVGRFRAFVRATGSTWHPAAGSGKHTHLPGGGLYSIKELATERGWDPAWNTILSKAQADWNVHLTCSGDASTDASWTPTPDANEDRPIVCVNWYDAYAFCIWDGGFLPSFAELNFAAVGGREQRTYPWGDGPVDLNHAQFCQTMPCTLIDVGLKVPGNGRYGQSDLAGNVWEWVLDTDAPTMSDGCDDCVISNAGSDERVDMGGGFDGIPATLTGDSYSHDPPIYSDHSNGFRCARSP
jgi:formylglycine-generating enzyme required for sulfatase activity